MDRKLHNPPTLIRTTSRGPAEPPQSRSLPPRPTTLHIHLLHRIRNILPYLPDPGTHLTLPIDGLAPRLLALEMGRGADLLCRVQTRS